MNDKGINVLEKYDFTVFRTYRGRGALVLVTDRGIKILKEYGGSARRLLKQEQLLKQIEENSCVRVDSLVRNKEGELLSEDKDRVHYYVRNWFEGTECDVRSLEHVRISAQKLARLHNIMKLPELVSEEIPVDSLSRQLMKRTRELSKTRTFIRARSQKSGFENFYLSCFSHFYEQAASVEEMCDLLSEKDFYETVRREGAFCHGDYTYHNLIYAAGDMAVINFERFVHDTPVRDLGNFCRKVCEKNNWSTAFGQAVLDGYTETRKLSEEEWNHLCLRLAYPEKFWKITNHYYNSRKAFHPEKNTEKLSQLIESENRKIMFLKELFQISL